MDVKESRRRIIMNEPHILAAQGHVAHFETDIVSKLAKISGTAGVITKCGKNLFDYVNADMYDLHIRNDSGVEIYDGSNAYSRQKIPVNPGTIYTMSGFKFIQSGNAKRIYFLGYDGNWISRTAGFYTSPQTFTTPENCFFIQIQTRKLNDETIESIQIEEGGSMTLYEPYSKVKYNNISEIRASRGINNIYSNSNLITVNYWTH